ncbi:MAG TPA: tRNA uridine-5-carboxymethylaminomethyl(34) synthesis enzyme MnmG [Candidatus Sulfotelmatobacter sp.]|nr:tRNA uridine-5-carboxymethylaminomethyl(34) synthesis enzyme MnmG [Candidatus Sulfotelmatobacter sp.]
MFIYPKQYDVIVIGAGHAGIEAALAAARMGCQTLLLTMNVDSIGQMSCNPAIGGLAKGHLAREIDALGGEMGKATDMTGLQFRMLNTKKGPAVWAPRAQCDKKHYQFRLKWVCETTPNLDVKQGQTAKILHKDGVACGVETTLEVQYHGKTVVITTGTFLRGLMHIGFNQQSGGRAGDVAAGSLSGSLKELGLELARLKTGTPPRLLRRSIDFSQTEIQPGDEPVPYFTYWKDELFHVEQFDCRFQGTPNESKYPPGSVLAKLNGQLPCYITFTNDKTAKIIRDNLHKSPLYAGKIEGVGPRYCPSIEDKIVKFPDKERHQVFLEPEGIETDEFYVNGCSTSLPFEVQVEMIRTIKGCENAEIMRPAYAVEYDFAYPTQLFPSLETKVCRNLYLAGQINGTSGYEEAGAQGIMAGINAARRTQNLEPIVLRRDQAYIGVLIDDLVTKGTTEPYRMFTSRAEYRLLLRQDNADLRLCDIGHDIGLLPERNYRKFQAKKQAIDDEIRRLNSNYYIYDSLAKILSRPETSYDDLPGRDDSLPQEVVEQVEIAIKYAGYVERQELEVEKFKKLEDKQIPGAFDFSTVPGLRLEARQKLAKIRPATIGQAARISGVSPADIGILMVCLKRFGESGAADTSCEPCGVED